MAIIRRNTKKNYTRRKKKPNSKKKRFMRYIGKGLELYHRPPSYLPIPPPRAPSLPIPPPRAPSLPKPPHPNLPIPPPPEPKPALEPEIPKQRRSLRQIIINSDKNKVIKRR